MCIRDRRIDSDILNSEHWFYPSLTSQDVFILFVQKKKQTHTKRNNQQQPKQRRRRPTLTSTTLSLPTVKSLDNELDSNFTCRRVLLTWKRGNGKRGLKNHRNMVRSEDRWWIFARNTKLGTLCCREEKTFLQACMYNLNISLTKWQDKLDTSLYDIPSEPRLCVLCDAILNHD